MVQVGGLPLGLSLWPLKLMGSRVLGGPEVSGPKVSRGLGDIAVGPTVLSQALRP